MIRKKDRCCIRSDQNETILSRKHETCKKGVSQMQTAFDSPLCLFGYGVGTVVAVPPSSAPVPSPARSAVKSSELK